MESGKPTCKSPANDVQASKLAKLMWRYPLHRWSAASS